MYDIIIFQGCEAMVLKGGQDKRHLTTNILQNLV